MVGPNLDDPVPRRRADASRAAPGRRGRAPAEAAVADANVNALADAYVRPMHSSVDASPLEELWP